MPRVLEEWPNDKMIQYLDGQIWEFVQGEDYTDLADKALTMEKLRLRVAKNGMRHKIENTVRGFAFQAWKESRG
jgi:hypothetical protein